MPILKSRPDEPDDSGLSSFTLEEVELLCAFLSVTRLGTGTRYSEAAMSLMTKIEDFTDPKFMDDAVRRVNLMVDVLDRNSRIIETYSHKDIEIDV